MLHPTSNSALLSGLESLTREADTVTLRFAVPASSRVITQVCRCRAAFFVLGGDGGQTITDLDIVDLPCPVLPESIDAVLEGEMLVVSLTVAK